jgi:hypothetical protein
MDNVFMLIFIMLNAIMLSVVMDNVFMLNVVMQSVVAPVHSLHVCQKISLYQKARDGIRQNRQQQQQ